jgi:hypothetical protein
LKTSLLIAALAAATLFACSGNDSTTQSAASELSFHQQPRVVIDKPATSAFVATSADGMVDVSGTARGSGVLINGQRVAVDGSGNFHARVAAKPGINVIDAQLDSLWGGQAQRAFIYGDFAPAGAMVKSGVLVRATALAFDDHEPSLNDFSSIAKALLMQTDVMQYLKLLPPITYDFGIGSVDVTVVGASFAKEKTALDLSPKAVGAHLDGALSSLVLDLHLVLHLVGDHPSNATVSVDTVGFVGDIDAQYSNTAQVPDPNNPGHTITGPGIVASMALPTITLGQLAISTDINFPGVNAFISWLANEFRGTIASAVATAIQQNSANHFAAALNQLGLPTSFDLHSFGLPATLAVDEAFDDKTAFDDAGATISASTAFAWPANANGPGRDAPGSLAIGGSRDAAFPEAPFGVSISFDALNQAVFAVWGQSGLQRTVLDAKDFYVFKLDPVVATPLLPPVLQPMADGTVQLALGDVQISTTLHNRFFTGNVTATVSAYADVTVALDTASNSLRFTLSGKPTISIDVSDVLGVIPDALLEPLSEALQALAPTVVANVIKPVAVPLPRLPLAQLIQGATGAVGLADPATIAVDAAGARVTVSGSLAVAQ